MTYFTIVHWFAILIIILLFILILVLTFQNSEGKFPLPAILTNAFAMSVLLAFAIYGIDKFTKLAKLENVTQKKILISESFSISGQIRNTGNFNIGKCVLEVKLSNDSLETNGGEPLVFAPKSGLENFFKRETTNTQAIETVKEFVIAENLHKGEMRNFSVFMRYPPSFTKPYTRYELYCH